MAKLLAIVFGLCAVLFMVCALPYEEGETAGTTKDPISAGLTQPSQTYAPPAGTEMPSQNASYTMPPAAPPAQPAPPSQNQTAPGYTMPPAPGR